uniref:ATPase AAA-type core domain-containing protein n=1 Tax=Globisporangium ultimum (strain ATCC 200006 / CBS 805.95 / DAOM BR144) TaxID=431595 RepID=K3WNY8_GLOUD
MKNNRFVLFSSPPASGKTSLLKLFATSSDHLYCFYVSCLDLKGRPCYNVVEELASKARNKRVDIIVLDDAQEVYDQSDFWIQLVKKTSLMVSDGVKFIICNPFVDWSSQFYSS